MAKPNTFFVLSIRDHWVVRQQGCEKTLAGERDKEAAIETARELAFSNQPSRVLVQRNSGVWELQFTYDGDNLSPQT